MVGGRTAVRSAAIRAGAAYTWHTNLDTYERIVEEDEAALESARVELEARLRALEERALRLLLPLQ
jgi:hypothetical protein